MTVHEMREFIAAAQTHGIDDALFQRGSTSIRVTGLNPAASSEISARPVANETPPKPEIKADQVGVLRLSHPSQTGEALAQGRVFKAGEVLAFLEVGQTLKPIIAPVDGMVEAVVADDGAVVGYGSPLLQYATVMA